MFFAKINDNYDDNNNKKEDASAASTEGEKEKEMESMVGSKNDFSLKGMTIYDKVGFQEDQIALGIDPDAVSINMILCDLYLIPVEKIL